MWDEWDRVSTSGENQVLHCCCCCCVVAVVVDDVVVVVVVGVFV